jgi:hypothetical protein
MTVFVLPKAREKLADLVGEAVPEAQWDGAARNRR